MTTLPTTANDAEISLLGAAMSGAPIDPLTNIIQPNDFYTPAHADVWSAILRVHHAGNQPDPITVRLALTTAGDTFDPIRLLDYTQLCPTPAQAEFYANTIAQAAGLRRIQTAGIKIQQLGTTPGDLDDIREQARQTIDQATQGHHTTTARTIGDLLPDVLDIAENGQTGILSTGWPDLDRTIGGLGPGRLVVVGARPGVGKSLMGTNLALHFADRHKHAVLIASMEMPEREVGQRLLAAYARADLTGLQMGRTDERTWQRIGLHAQALMDLPITIDDTAGQTVTHIRKAARDAQRKREDLALIVVDYLQLIRPTDAKVNRAEQVGEISRGLKLLARESGACVVAMAQVNRESTKRTDGRPTMADLRESGAIEADADQVVLLHHPDDEVPEVEVLTDKNRHGPKGRAVLQIQGHYARLVSVGGVA